jgi:hypothetical protein
LITGEEPFFKVGLVARVRWIGGADVRVTVVGDLEALQGWFSGGA